MRRPEDDQDDREVDEWLVGKARGGNPDAYEVLVRRHQARVYRIALRILGDPADAEDVTQEVFVQVWSALAGFGGQSAFTTWLYRIAVNRSLNHRRRRRRTEPIEDHEPVTRIGPEEATVGKARAQATARAIADLPADLRSVFVLHQSEQLSYQDIGKVLGLSEPTVRGRLARARRTLLDQLREWT